MTHGKDDQQITQGKRGELLAEFGPLISGKHLTKALGFPSQQAFRQAVRRGTVPVKVFEIAGRRGKFALTEEVECWLTRLSSATEEKT